MSSRAKGRRTLNKAKDYYEGRGWLVDEVELGGRFRKSKDLFSGHCFDCGEVCGIDSHGSFSGFDLICLKEGVVKFVQVKTNTPATQGPYSDFAQEYAARNVRIEGWTWYDHQGPVIHKFHKNGKVTRIDKR